MDKYIVDQIENLYKVASAGASPEEVIELMDKIKELIKKNKEVKDMINNPERTASMEFGDKNPEKEIVTREVDLQPFGTPEEPSNKGMGM